MAGILGFLLLAWVFYVRRTIALGSVKPGYRTFFNLCPLILVFFSFICYVRYMNTLDKSLAQAHVTRVLAIGTWSRNNAVPESLHLQLLYLGMFLLAEAAFVIMALREYSIDVLRISEYDWMFGSQEGSPPTATLPDSGAHQS
jgi:hypothetical protein